MCEVYARGVHLVRATDCKPFAEKPLWGFSTVSARCESTWLFACTGESEGMGQLVTSQESGLEGDGLDPNQTIQDGSAEFFRPYLLLER